MLWLLGTICVLLGLLVFMVKRIYDGFWKLLSKVGAMLMQLDVIVDQTRSSRLLLEGIVEEPADIRARERNFAQLKDIPEILRHVMALRELTYGRQKTEHDTLGEWPSVSPREEFQESRKKRRAATSKGEADQESADESKP